jgi:hypothetical protein
MTINPKKHSKAALKTFLAEDNVAEVVIPDRRAIELHLLDGEDATFLKAIQEVFAGTGLADNQEKVRRIFHARNEIQKEWGDARDSFLAIGRALIELENELTKVEFSRLRQGSERLFPFSDATATQLRQIARAVDGGRIPAEACPGSYGTAYQITLLSELQLEVARKRGLIRPSVTRREIMQLRREITSDGVMPALSGRLDHSKLRKERARLVERRMRLSEELVHRFRGTDQLRLIPSRSHML